MKILFIKPNNLADHIQPSLGFGYLAAQLRDHHDVVIHDCIKDHTPVERIDLIVDRHNPDLVGIQCYTFDVPKVREMTRRIKEAHPNTIVTVGGAHISSIPAQSFEQLQPYVDYAFAGECEFSFPRFVAELERNNGTDFSNIDGLVAHGRNGHPIANPQTLIPDLDSLGFPAWDLMPPETYPESQHGAFYEKFPIAPIITTRGCPYACQYCSAPMLSGQKLRHHSVEYIQEQISMLYGRGIREIHIVDDNFTFDMDYAKAVMRGIIDMNLDISLATPNGIRMDRLDDELLELMKEAGIYLLSVAVESGSNRILKKMRKAITVEKIRDKIALITKHKIPVAGFFILGYPTETREEMEATIRFSKELGLIRANFFTYLPLPGTPSYYQLVESGDIERVDWSNFLFMSAPYTPEGISREELLKIKKRAFLSFHLQPSTFIKNVRAIKSLRHFMFLLRRFYHWIIMKPKPATAKEAEIWRTESARKECA